MGAKKELLDELLELTGFLYISDLRRQAAYKKIKKAVVGIEPHCYSADEWRDVYSYVTGISADKETEEEIRALFEQLE